MIFIVPKKPVKNSFFFKEDMVTFARIKKQYNLESLCSSIYDRTNHPEYPLIGPTNLGFWSEE